MATIGRKSARRAGQNAHNGALDDRKVHSKLFLRTFEHTGRLSSIAKAVPSG